MPDDDADVRGFWSGTLTFGLVSIPVELFPGVRSERPSLRMLSAEGAPLRRAYFGEDDQELSSEDIVRGFEVDDGFIVVEDEELEALEPERSRDIHLRRFVPRADISPAWFRRAYLLAPAGESTRPYAVLARTMAETDRAGIATFVMRGKEYIVALFAEGGVLRAMTLRFEDELRSPADVGLESPPASDAKLAKAMRKAIAKATSDAIPEDALEDARAEALRALAEDKRARGEGVVEAPDVEVTEEDDDEPADLVQLLKERLRSGKKNENDEQDDLEASTKSDLYERAKQLDISGRSSMSKDELIASIRKAQAA